MTSGFSALRSSSIARLDRVRIGQAARRLGAARRQDDARLVRAALVDVVGQVQVDRARAAVDAGAHRLLHVVGDALDAVGTRRVLDERARGFDLRRLLEGAHVVLVGVVRPAQQQHRPAVGPGVRQARDAVHHARPADGQARARAAGQIADGAGGVARRLLVAKAVVADSLFLRGHRHADHGEPDHAEHVVHALLLQTAGDNSCAADFGHGDLQVAAGRAILHPVILLRARSDTDARSVAGEPR